MSLKDLYRSAVYSLGYYFIAGYYWLEGAVLCAWVWLTGRPVEQQWQSIMSSKESIDESANAAYARDVAPEWVTGRCECGGRWVCEKCGTIVR